MYFASKILRSEIIKIYNLHAKINDYEITWFADAATVNLHFANNLMCKREKSVSNI